MSVVRAVMKMMDESDGSLPVDNKMSDIGRAQGYKTLVAPVLREINAIRNLSSLLENRRARLDATQDAKVGLRLVHAIDKENNADCILTSASWQSQGPSSTMLHGDPGTEQCCLCAKPHTPHHDCCTFRRFQKSTSFSHLLSSVLMPT